MRYLSAGSEPLCEEELHGLPIDNIDYVVYIIYGLPDGTLVCHLNHNRENTVLSKQRQREEGGEEQFVPPRLLPADVAWIVPVIRFP